MSSSAPPEVKAQHYIPEFYLKGFTSNRKLWVCEKFKPIRESTPKREGCLPDYYTHTEYGERDESAEDTLEKIESGSAPVIRKLANSTFKPSPEQMGAVYLFVAFMFARVPRWREYLDKLFSHVAKERQLSIARDKEQFHKQVADFEHETGKPLPIDAETLRQGMLEGEYEIVQTSTAYNLDSMFRSAFGVVRELEQFEYEVLYAPTGRFFITSDSPVSTVQPQVDGLDTIGVGFGLPNVIVHFPLNKRACLRLRRGVKPEAFHANAYDMDVINHLTMMTATRNIYLPERNRRISRIFDQCGCTVAPGKNAFMLESPKQSPPRR